MHMFIYCSCPLSHFRAWHPFHIHVKWVGYPFPPSQDYSIEFILHRLVTLPVIHGVWCLFRRVILSNLPTSLKIVCLETYSLSSPSYQSNFNRYLIYPCFVSIDGGYIKASLRQISSCRPQHIIQERNLETCHSCGTLETIFIIGGFPHGC